MMRRLWPGRKNETIYNEEFHETSISLFKIVLVFLIAAGPSTLNRVTGKVHRRFLWKLCREGLGSESSSVVAGEEGGGRMGEGAVDLL